ncbi:DUF5317 domain-containing protein [Actinacidiphila bryophytorum]|uniref:DUF5317 domain-containing protein n=1 Tax=Actinacidiphila bryophytorum TaxID=1436133 RepID=UPI002176B06C|nr:DUF5317 domain-containing protein [Actinacidiphila bryophytorum]UWE12769.1 DUF5317 domain-containing protein [Actinacidiphila bryophytorum]
MGFTALILFGGPVAVGAVAGYLTGGRLNRLAGIRLRQLWLVWLAAAVQVVQLATARLPGAAGHRLRGPLLALAIGLALLWLCVNALGRARTLQAAVGLALTGALLNALPIAANGRMPYSRSAAATAGLHAGAQTAKNVAAGRSTHLLALGDTIPLARLHAVISIGDILLATAAALLVAAAMHQPADTARERNRPCPAPSPGSA